MPAYYNQRDDIADTLMQQRGASTFDYGLAGLGSAQQPMASMTAGPQLAGLPQTPAGGVPGSGLATAAPSTVQLPPQRTGMQGAMPSMPMMGGLGAMPSRGAVPIARQMLDIGDANAAQPLGRMRTGIGHITDFEGDSRGRRRGY